MGMYMGLSDLAASWQMQRQNTDVKNALFSTGQQLSSGERSIQNIAKAGEVQKLFAFDASLSVLERYSQAADHGRVKLEAVQMALGSIRDVASNVSLSVLSAVKSDDMLVTSVEARGAFPALETIVANLNQNIAGEGLFSGAATDRAAVVSASQIQADIDAIVLAAPDAATALTNIDFYFHNPAGGFTTTSYTGSTSNGPDIRVGENETITMPIRADDPAVKETIRNLAIIGAVSNGGLAGSVTDQKILLLDAANTNLNTSDSLIQLREQTGYDQERLERAVSRNEAEVSRLQVARVGVANVDPYETATKFQELQVQLEKMFTVTARLGQLSLTNFLR